MNVSPCFSILELIGVCTFEVSTLESKIYNISIHVSRAIKSLLERMCAIYGSLEKFYLRE